MSVALSDFPIFGVYSYAIRQILNLESPNGIRKGGEIE